MKKTTEDLLAQDKQTREDSNCISLAKVQPDNQPINSPVNSLIRQRKIEEVVAAYQKAIEIEPDNNIIYAKLARAMMTQKNIQGAIEAYQKAIELEPEQPVWVYHELGNAFHQNGQLEEAIYAYQIAIELEPDYTHFYLSPAKLHYEKGDLDIEKAIFVYQKAIELKPDHPYFYLSLAKLHYEKGDLDSVIENYRQAISLKQNQPLPLWVYKSLGEALRLQGRGDEATTSLKSTLYIKEKSDNEKYKIVVCATFKNEAPYILEWIAYHRIMKVDHFLIYNNDSTDETPEILQRLDCAGIITCINWPSNPNINNQLAAYKDAYLRLVGKCEWVAFIDGDEFIVLNKDNDLHSFLSNYKDVAGIAINWKIFGSSGHRLKSDGLVMERFKRCTESISGGNRHIKTIAKIDLIQDIPNVHYCEYLNNSLYVYPNRALVPKKDKEKDKAKSADVNHDLVQINHYFTKSQVEWNLKRARGRATKRLNSPDKIRPQRNCDNPHANKERDLNILRFLEKTKQEIKILTELADLESIVTNLSSKTIIKTDNVANVLIPLLTKKTLKFLKDFLAQKPDAKVLEFGSGDSILWLSQFTKNLVSINPVNLKLLPRPYKTICEEFPNKFFDLIIIEGCDRVECLEASIRILKRGGVLMLDDAQKESYQKSCNFLQNWDFTRTIEPRSKVQKQTNWWEKPLTFDLLEPQDKVQILGVERLSGNNTDLLSGFGLGSLKAERQYNADSIPIKGWVLGKKSRAVAVKVSCGDRVLKETPVNNARPDVAKVHSQVPGAGKSGFANIVSLVGMPSNFELFIQAILEDGSCISIAKVRLDKQPNILSSSLSREEDVSDCQKAF